MLSSFFSLTFYLNYERCFFGSVRASQITVYVTKTKDGERSKVCISLHLNSLLLSSYINRDLNISINFSKISNICVKKTPSMLWNRIYCVTGYTQL